MAEATNKPQTATKPNATPAGNGKRAQRTNPVPVGFVDSIPPAVKGSFWKDEFEVLKQNPGKTKLYRNASSTTATNLKRNYGLHAVTRNVEGGHADLYVTWYPERAESIKQEAQENTRKRREAAKAAGK